MVQLHFNGYYLTAGLLALCTVIGIVVAARFRREVDEDLTPATSKELLDPLEKAFYSGLMRPEEIERIRASVNKGPVAETIPDRPVTRPKPGRPPGATGGDPMFDHDLDRGPTAGPSVDESDELSPP